MWFKNSELVKLFFQEKMCLNDTQSAYVLRMKSLVRASALSAH